MIAAPSSQICTAVTTEMWSELLSALVSVQIGGLLAGLIIFYGFILPLLDRFVAPVLESVADRHAARLIDRFKGRK